MGLTETAIMTMYVVLLSISSFFVRVGHHQPRETSTTSI